MSRKTKRRGHAEFSARRSRTLIDLDTTLRVEERLSLRCGLCGESRKYHVGTVMLDPAEAGSDDAEAFENAVGFTGYFRCRSCDGGGPWALPARTRTEILAMATITALGADDTPLEFGCLATFDQWTFRYATEGEAHLKELIDREPERAFLWVRLGNLYRTGEAYERAERAYRRALELDPDDIEAHAMLGQVLVHSGRSMDAVPCWHAVLSHARGATHLKRDLLRNLVRGAIAWLLEAHAESDGQIDLLPEFDPAKPANQSKDEPLILEVRELDLSSEEGIEDLCDAFVGHRQGRWSDVFPRRERRVFEASNVRIAAPLRHEGPPVARNKPCPCGSGHKYKKCCGRR